MRNNVKKYKKYNNNIKDRLNLNYFQNRLVIWRYKQIKLNLFLNKINLLDLL